jgi:hypothetical protein
MVLDDPSGAVERLAHAPRAALRASPTSRSQDSQASCQDSSRGRTSVKPCGRSSLRERTCTTDDDHPAVRNDHQTAPVTRRAPASDTPHCDLLLPRGAIDRCRHSHCTGRLTHLREYFPLKMLSKMRFGWRRLTSVRRRWGDRPKPAARRNGSALGSVSGALLTWPCPAATAQPRALPRMRARLARRPRAGTGIWPDALVVSKRRVLLKKT